MILPRRPYRIAALILAPTLLVAGTSRRETIASSAVQRDTASVLGTPDEPSWRELSPGLELATVSGDPMIEGKPYAVALRLASGRWIQPHWHPNEKVIAVMSGALFFGQGEDSRAIPHGDDRASLKLPDCASGFCGSAAEAGAGD